MRLTGGDSPDGSLIHNRARRFRALPPAVDGEYLRTLEDSGAWRNNVTLRSLQYLMDCEPAAWLPFVALGGHFDT
jgi:hypothetical protein